MRCYLCGRVLLHVAATVETVHGKRYAGPTCARRAGLLPARVSRPRIFTVRPRRQRDTGQMEIPA